MIKLITDHCRPDQSPGTECHDRGGARRRGGQGLRGRRRRGEEPRHQTAKATEEISSQIAGIQQATEELVVAIREIGTTIERVAGIAGSIAAAVEEQGAATQEIARNVQQAAQGTSQVNAISATCIAVRRKPAPRRARSWHRRSRWPAKVPASRSRSTVSSPPCAPGDNRRRAVVPLRARAAMRGSAIKRGHVVSVHRQEAVHVTSAPERHRPLPSARGPRVTSMSEAAPSAVHFRKGQTSTATPAEPGGSR